MKNNSIYDSSLVPVDGLAARVVAPGVPYKPSCTVQVPEYIAPPPMAPKRKHPRAKTFVDLTGRKKGRLTVLGLLADNHSLWVVRCSCGMYTVRTSRSIKSTETNPRANIDACRECMHLVFLKREEIWRNTKRDVDLEDVWS